MSKDTLEKRRKRWAAGYEDFGSIGAARDRDTTFMTAAWDAGYDAAKAAWEQVREDLDVEELALEAYPDPPAPMFRWAVYKGDICVGTFGDKGDATLYITNYLPTSPTRIVKFVEVIDE